MSGDASIAQQAAWPLRAVRFALHAMRHPGVLVKEGQRWYLLARLTAAGFQIAARLDARDVFLVR